MKKTKKIGMMTLVLLGISFLGISNVSAAYAVEKDDIYVWYMNGDVTLDTTSVSFDILIKAVITEANATEYTATWSAYDRTTNTAPAAVDVETMTSGMAGDLIIDAADVATIVVGGEAKTVTYAGESWEATVADASASGMSAKIAYSNTGVMLETKVKGSVDVLGMSMEFDFSIELVSIADEDLATYSPPGGIPGFPLAIFSLVSIASILLISKKIRK